MSSNSSPPSPSISSFTRYDIWASSFAEVVYQANARTASMPGRTSRERLTAALKSPSVVEVIGSGWRVLTSNQDVAVFDNRDVNTTFVACRGSEELWRDWTANDLLRGLGINAGNRVQSCWKQVAAHIPNGTTLIITGHSLGGSVAMGLAQIFDVPAITFNAPDLHSGGDTPGSRHFRAISDLISGWFAPNSTHVVVDTGTRNPIVTHGMQLLGENLRNLSNVVSTIPDSEKSPAGGSSGTVNLEPEVRDVVFSEPISFLLFNISRETSVHVEQFGNAHVSTSHFIELSAEAEAGLQAMAWSGGFAVLDNLVSTHTSKASVWSLVQRTGYSGLRTVVGNTFNSATLSHVIPAKWLQFSNALACSGFDVIYQLMHGNSAGLKAAAAGATLSFVLSCATGVPLTVGVVSHNTNGALFGGNILQQTIKRYQMGIGVEACGVPASLVAFFGTNETIYRHRGDNILHVRDEAGVGAVVGPAGAYVSLGSGHETSSVRVTPSESGDRVTYTWWTRSYKMQGQCHVRVGDRAVELVVLPAFSSTKIKHKWTFRVDGGADSITFSPDADQPDLVADWQVPPSTGRGGPTGGERGEDDDFLDDVDRYPVVWQAGSLAGAQALPRPVLPNPSGAQTFSPNTNLISAFNQKRLHPPRSHTAVARAYLTPISVKGVTERRGTGKGTVTTRKSTAWGVKTKKVIKTYVSGEIKTVDSVVVAPDRQLGDGETVSEVTTSSTVIEYKDLIEKQIRNKNILSKPKWSKKPASKHTITSRFGEVENVKVFSLRARVASTTPKVVEGGPSGSTMAGRRATHTSTTTVNALIVKSVTTTPDGAYYQTATGTELELGSRNDRYVSDAVPIDSVPGDDSLARQTITVVETQTGIESVRKETLSHTQVRDSSSKKKHRKAESKEKSGLEAAYQHDYAFGEKSTERLNAMAESTIMWDVKKDGTAIATDTRDDYTLSEEGREGKLHLSFTTRESVETITSDYTNVVDPSNLHTRDNSSSGGLFQKSTSVVLRGSFSHVASSSDKEIIITVPPGLSIPPTQIGQHFVEAKACENLKVNRGVVVRTDGYADTTISAGQSPSFDSKIDAVNAVVTPSTECSTVSEAVVTLSVATETTMVYRTYERAVTQDKEESFITYTKMSDENLQTSHERYLMSITDSKTTVVSVQPEKSAAGGATQASESVADASAAQEPPPSVLDQWTQEKNYLDVNTQWTKHEGKWVDGGFVQTITSKADVDILSVKQVIVEGEGLSAVLESLDSDTSRQDREPLRQVTTVVCKEGANWRSGFMIDRTTTSKSTVNRQEAAAAATLSGIDAVDDGLNTVRTLSPAGSATTAAVVGGVTSLLLKEAAHWTGLSNEGVQAGRDGKSLVVATVATATGAQAGEVLRVAAANNAPLLGAAAGLAACSLAAGAAFIGLGDEKKKGEVGYQNTAQRGVEVGAAACRAGLIAGATWRAASNAATATSSVLVIGEAVNAMASIVDYCVSSDPMESGKVVIEKCVRSAVSTAISSGASSLASSAVEGYVLTSVSGGIAVAAAGAVAFACATFAIGSLWSWCRRRITDYVSHSDEIAERDRLAVELEVSPTATPAQMRAAFRAGVLRNHPDKAGGSNEKFETFLSQYKRLTQLLVSTGVHTQSVQEDSILNIFMNALHCWLSTPPKDRERNLMPALLELCEMSDDHIEGIGGRFERR